MASQPGASLRQMYGSDFYVKTSQIHALENSIKENCKFSTFSTNACVLVFFNCCFEFSYF